MKRRRHDESNKCFDTFTNLSFDTKNCMTSFKYSACQLTFSLVALNFHRIKITQNSFPMKVLIAFWLTLVFLVAKSSRQFYILHTNDVHSHFEMFSANSKTCKIENVKPDDKRTKCYGGAVRRSGFIKDFRSKHKNVLLLDAGDQYQGTLWFTTFRGNVTSHFLKHMKYDVMVGIIIYQPTSQNQYQARKSSLLYIYLFNAMEAILDTILNKY